MSNDLFLAAFAEIVSLYQERKDVGGFGPMSLEADPGAPQRTYLSPKPTVTDFILDVDLAITRSLDPQETRFFAHWFKSLKADPASEPGSHVDRTVRTKLGRSFVERGIYPIAKYLEA